MAFTSIRPRGRDRCAEGQTDVQKLRNGAFRCLCSKVPCAVLPPVPFTLLNATLPVGPGTPKPDLPTQASCQAGLSKGLGPTRWTSNEHLVHWGRWGIAWDSSYFSCVHPSG